MVRENPKTKVAATDGTTIATNADVKHVKRAITNLLANQDGSLSDKIATVKTAQVMDKSQFEAAFKTLMNK